MSTIEKKVRVHKKDYSGFQSYILKVLKGEFPDSSISSIALNQLSDLTHILINEIGIRATAICRRLKTITFTSRTIQFATKSILTGELQKRAVDEGIKRTVIYNATVSEQDAAKPKGTKKKSSTLQNKAQLTISPSRVMSVLRGFRYRLSVTSGVYCAAVIEYLLVEILELARDYARDNNKTKITSKHIQTIIKKDPELNFLSKTLKIEFSKGGVVPFIHPELIPTKEQSKKNSKNRVASRIERGAVKGGPRRALPGSKSIRDIKKYQKTVDILGQKAPFERVTRMLLKSIKIDVRFSAQVLEQFQLFCEARIVDFYSKAQSLAINSGREGVSFDDVKMVYELENSTIQDLPNSILIDAQRGNKNGTNPTLISMKPALKRMARKGGVKRLSIHSHSIMTHIYTSIIYTVLLAATNETEMSKTRTITIPILESSIHSLGFNFILSNS